MGQARKAHLEKQRAVEKLKKRAIATALSIGLGGAAFVGYNLFSDKATKATAGEAIKPSEKATEMPEDIKDLLKKTSSPEAPVDRLIGLPYKELTNFKVGPHDIRVIQAGGEFEFGALDTAQLASIKKNYEVFAEFAKSGAKMDMPVFEADETDKIISARTMQAQVGPLTKDIVMFLVPARVDIGQFSTSKLTAPVTFTDSQGPVSVSFARPDVANGFEGVMVEACQATIDVQITNRGEFSDVNTEKFSDITLLAQENVCNSIAKATYMVNRGLPFDFYVQTHSRQLLGGTHQPEPGNNVFYATEPYVGSEPVYNSLINGIPTNIGDSFTYPPVN